MQELSWVLFTKLKLFQSFIKYRLLGLGSVRKWMMVTLQKNFGKNFRCIRKEKGLSQEDLAERIGISATYISQLETGKQNPTFATIEKLIQGLGVSFLEAFAFIYTKDVQPSDIRNTLKAIIDDADDQSIQALYEKIIDTYKMP